MQKNNPIQLIVHHIGGTDKYPLMDSSYQTFEQINEYHRVAVDENGDFKYHYGKPSMMGYWMAYHYFIDRNGIEKQARREDEVGMATKGQNANAIQICLAGNFDATLPTRAQEMALRSLLKSLSIKYGIKPENIVPHRHYANKTCYGRNLHDNWASSLVSEEDPAIIESLTFEVKRLTQLILKILQEKLNSKQK